MSVSAQPNIVSFPLQGSSASGSVLYRFTGRIPSGSQTGSALVDVSRYTMRDVYAYINPTSLVASGSSGSIVVSGSFDGSTTFLYRQSAIFFSGSSGSAIHMAFETIPWIGVYILNAAAVAGTNITGSIFLTVMP